MSRQRTKARVYLASSWRNADQPALVDELSVPYDVYDFRNPQRGGPNARTEDNTLLGAPAMGGGFQWSEIDPQWKHWTPTSFGWALDTHTADRGYRYDKEAMDWADVCVMALPCGRSAHLEAGYFAGHPDKALIVYLPQDLASWEGPTPGNARGRALWEPELMYKMADQIVLKREDLSDAINAMYEKLARERRRVAAERESL